MERAQWSVCVCILINEQIPLLHVLTTKTFKIVRVCILILKTCQGNVMGAGYDLAMWTYTSIVLLPYACLKLYFNKNLPENTFFPPMLI